MKKTTVSIPYEDEKLSTLKLYIEQKGMQIETELEKYLDTLYAKYVPTSVREYLDMRAGNTHIVVSKPRKQKGEKGVDSPPLDAESQAPAMHMQPNEGN